MILKFIPFSTPVLLITACKFAFQLSAEALQESYRTEVGLQCTVIRLCWQYPLMANVYTDTTGINS
jgi:hypothetical protein